MAGLTTLSRDRLTGTHESAIESISAQSIVTQFADVNTLIVSELFNTTGESIISQHGRIIAETASQSQTAGEGRVWVRNDSVPMFTPDAGADVLLDRVGIGAINATGNDANNQPITNLLSLDMTSGIRLTNNSCTTLESTAVAIGYSDASGTGAVAIGYSSVPTEALLDASIAIGSKATAKSLDSGYGSESVLPGGVAIGYNTHVLGETVAIGSSNNCPFINSDNGGSCVAIGTQHGVGAGQNGAVMIGAMESGYTVGANDSVGLGTAKTVAGGGNARFVIIGHMAMNRTTEGGVAIGYDSAATSRSVAIGSGANTQAGGTDSLGIGYATRLSASAAVGLGSNLTNHSANSVCIGADSASFAANTISIGKSATCAATHIDSNVIAPTATSRTTRETVLPGATRVIYATKSTTGVLTGEEIVSFPTVAGDDFMVDAFVWGHNTNNDHMFAAEYRNYHLRNKSGTLTCIPFQGWRFDTTGGTFTTGTKFTQTGTLDADYYFWLDVNGDGTTDDPGGTGTSVPINISGGASEPQVAIALAAAITGANPNYYTSVLGNVVYYYPNEIGVRVLQNNTLNGWAAAAVEVTTTGELWVDDMDGNVFSAGSHGFNFSTAIRPSGTDISLEVDYTVSAPINWGATMIVTCTGAT